MSRRLATSPPARMTTCSTYDLDPELSIVSAAEHGLSNLQKLIDDELVDEQLGDDEKARFIYLAHHEGLGGARSFLRRTDSPHIQRPQKPQVGGRAQQYIDAAGGDTTQVYRNWLNQDMDDKIQPSKFRKSGTESSGGHGTKALSEFDGPPVPLADLGGRRELVKAVQWRLWELRLSGSAGGRDIRSCFALGPQ